MTQAMSHAPGDPQKSAKLELGGTDMLELVI
jgi:hypothetical protein